MSKSSVVPNTLQWRLHKFEDTEMWILLMAQDYQIDQANRWRCFYFSLPSVIIDSLEGKDIARFAGQQATYLGPRFGNLYVKKRNLQRLMRLVDSHGVIGYDFLGVPLDKQPTFGDFVYSMQQVKFSNLILDKQKQVAVDESSLAK